ncbi:hypothetical protein A3C77_04905 [Candidatus Giovannonibacteria bacterium RIFCSPHIGHO2_02_FULL_45_13]|nr:MAG: hypothetical protein A3C77_04905 [Candidatus Giovannonibacteria bacterium RIFCSPHIGHO2_02_FULL_45_13]
MIPIWLLPVFLRLIIGHVLQAALIKKITGQHSRTSRFLLTYLFCSAIGVISALIFGQLALDRVVMIVMIIGFFNAIAAYAHWVASDISMSRASLYLVFDDVLAMALGYYILSEAKFLNNGLSAGASVSLVTALFFMMYRNKKAELEAKLEAVKIGVELPDQALGAAKEKLLLKCVIYFSVTWGIAMFSMKYFGAQDVPPLKYIWAWYSGSLIGAIVVFVYSKTPIKDLRSFFAIEKIFYYKKIDEQEDEVLSLSPQAKSILQIFLLSVSMVSSLWASYWAYQAAHLIIIQPTFLVMEMIAPTLIGLYYFKEIKELDANEKTILVIGMLSGMLIAFNS